MAKGPVGMAERMHGQGQPTGETDYPLQNVKVI